MKNMRIIITIAFVTNISYSTPHQVNAPVSGNGWRYDQHNPGGYYKGIGGANDGYAWDVNYGSGYDDEGMPVYAIEDGCIYTENGWGGNTYGQLLINHTTGGDKWSSGYLHMKNIVKKTGCVKKGDKIGEISRVGYRENPNITSPHLHFAVYDSHGKYGLNSVNVIINKTTYPLTRKTDVAGIFDGAGSLISPNESCWGCDKDEARMHPHPGTGSTVVFQWLYDKDTCSQLDLYADSKIKVAIKAKSWKEHSTQKAFTVTLGTEPVTLTRPDSSNSWTTFAITSIEPISDMIPIKAFCRTSGDEFHKGDSKNIDKDLVDVTYNYYWTGTGSIITQVTNRDFDSYGVSHDLAVTFNSYNSLTSFQWLTSYKCNKLKIEDYSGESSKINGVYIKSWFAEKWGENQCGSSLPCIISSPKMGQYYIIKVKSEPNAIKSGALKAECVK